jgi:hypothetical protein
MTTPEINHKGELRHSLYGNTLKIPNINIIDPNSNIQREEASTPEWKPPRKPNGKLFALVLVSILLVIGIVIGGAIGGRVALANRAKYGIVRL